MSFTVDAIYENGVLKTECPLPLPDHTQVRVTIETRADALRRVQQTYGLLGWTGDAETVQRIALDPEFGILENP